MSSGCRANECPPVGIYLNPGNDGFQSARAGRYVDKMTHEETLQRVRDSIQLIKDTADGNADAVAAQVSVR